MKGGPEQNKQNNVDLAIHLMPFRLRVLGIEKDIRELSQSLLERCEGAKYISHLTPLTKNTRGFIMMQKGKFSTSIKSGEEKKKKKYVNTLIDPILSLTL